MPVRDQRRQVGAHGAWLLDWGRSGLFLAIFVAVCLFFSFFLRQNFMFLYFPISYLKNENLYPSTWKEILGEEFCSHLRAE